MKTGTGRLRKVSVGRMLIAFYILAVLAISATARAHQSDAFRLIQFNEISH